MENKIRKTKLRDEIEIESIIDFFESRVGWAIDEIFQKKVKARTEAEILFRNGKICAKFVHN